MCLYNRPCRLCYLVAGTLLGVLCWKFWRDSNRSKPLVVDTSPLIRRAKAAASNNAKSEAAQPTEPSATPTATGATEHSGSNPQANVDQPQSSEGIQTATAHPVTTLVSTSTPEAGSVDLNATVTDSEGSAVSVADAKTLAVSAVSGTSEPKPVVSESSPPTPKASPSSATQNGASVLAVSAASAVPTDEGDRNDCTGT